MHLSSLARNNNMELCVMTDMDTVSSGTPLLVVPNDLRKACTGPDRCPGPAYSWAACVVVAGLA